MRSLMLLLILGSCSVPHDIGEYNYLKTICHVWEGRDGYRREATVGINSDSKLHKYHPWDYDGKCQ
jgi:hypothetical protein